MAIPPKLALQIARRTAGSAAILTSPSFCRCGHRRSRWLIARFTYNKNHRAGATEDIVITNSLQIDHLIAQANQGTDDLENLFASAARRNIQMGKRTDWKPREVIEDDGGWDGGLSDFIALVDKHPEIKADPMVAKWYRAAADGDRCR